MAQGLRPWSDRAARRATRLASVGPLRTSRWSRSTCPGPGPARCSSATRSPRWTRACGCACASTDRPDTSASSRSTPPMDGILTVGEVVESRAEGFRARRRRPARLGVARLRESSTADEPALSGLGTLTRLDTSVAAAPAYLGPLGGMGLTAYAGLIDAAQLRAGDVVWVSAAAGAVGSLAAQIAKLRGHRVIGSAGSDDEGPSPARRPRPRRRLQLPQRPGRRAAARGGTGRDRRLLRQRRRRPPRGRARLPAPVGPGGAVRRAVGVRERLEPHAGPGNLFQATANDLTLRGFRGSSHLHRMRRGDRASSAGGSPTAACATARRSSTGSSTRRRRSCGCSPATRSARRWCASTSDAAAE